MVCGFDNQRKMPNRKSERIMIRNNLVTILIFASKEIYLIILSMVINFYLIFPHSFFIATVTDKVFKTMLNNKGVNE